MKTFECCHADTCLPCYWSGHHRPHVQIPVSNETTFQQVKDAIKGELVMGAVAGSNAPSDDDEDTYAALYRAVDHMELKDPNMGPDTVMFPDLESSEDYETGESVYAFFVFVEQGE